MARNKLKRAAVAVFGLASQLSGDTFYGKPPRIGTWSGHIEPSSATVGEAAARFVPATNITITRFQINATTTALTCSTSPVISIRDIVNSANLQNLTLSNGTQFFDSGVIATAVAAGSTINVALTTAGGTCSANAAGISFTVQYK